MQYSRTTLRCRQLRLSYVKEQGDSAMNVSSWIIDRLCVPLDVYNDAFNVLHVKLEITPFLVYTKRLTYSFNGVSSVPDRPAHLHFQPCFQPDSISSCLCSEIHFSEFVFLIKHQKYLTVASI